MKVVINRCFGWFSLSAAGLTRLSELQGRPCYVFTYDHQSDEYKPLRSGERESFLISAFDVPNPNDFCAPGVLTGSGLSPEERAARNDWYSLHSLDLRPENRADPLLVQVVEELGSKAAGACAELAVVNIPDGVEYEIEDYHGNEHVAEVHRTWR